MSDPATVYEALAAVMCDVGGVAKRDQNTQHGYAFRGVDAVVNAVGPALRAHGVIVLPDVREVRETTVEVGRNRTRMGHVTVLVGYAFVGPDGSTLTCSACGEAMDAGDKAGSKAMSVAYRTALIQALCLPTDEPDPDSSSYERSEPPPLMTSSQQTAIAAALAGLDDDDTAAVKAWWSAAGFPSLRSGHLTEDQAVDVLARLEWVVADVPSS